MKIVGLAILVIVVAISSYSCSAAPPYKPLVEPPENSYNINIGANDHYGGLNQQFSNKIYEDDKNQLGIRESVNHNWGPGFSPRTSLGFGGTVTRNLYRTDNKLGSLDFSASYDNSYDGRRFGKGSWRYGLNYEHKF